MCCAAAVKLLLFAESSAEARPEGFAEALVGMSVAVGTSGYAEEHDGPTPHVGARGGAWLARGRQGRAWGVELQVDHATFASPYEYARTYEDPPGTLVIEGVRASYSRLRVMVGGRAALPIHLPVQIVLRGAAGIDRVSGSEEETSPLVEIGGQLGVRLGPVRLGVELGFAVAFHHNEHPLSYGTPPVQNPGYEPGYDRTVDFIVCAAAGAGF